jgi:MFS family permease
LLESKEIASAVVLTRERVRPVRARALVPVLLFIGTVVSIVSSLGAPLIPTLSRDLHTSLASAQWALTATLLVGAVASPLVGRLGDGRHRKQVIMACLTLVVLGGALAALAGSLAQLLVARAMQGMGLALIPLTMAVAREHLAPARARRAIAALSVVGAAGVGLGYPITGFISEHLDVWAAYWFGTAVSAAALVLAALTIPRPDGDLGRQKVDLLGAGLISVGIVAVLLGLEEGPDWGWGSLRLIALLLAGALFVACWVFVELQARHPLVDLRLVRHRAVLTANVTGAMLGTTMYLVLVLVTQVVQAPGYGFGASVFVGGLTLVPLSILSALGSRTLPWLEQRVGLRPVLPAGALAVAVSAGFFGVTATHLWQAFVTMGLLGIGLGFTFAAMPGLIVGHVPPNETGSAMGFYQVSRFAGFSVGSGVAVTLLRAFGQHGQLTAGSYRSTALVAAVLAVLTALVAWILPGRRETAMPDEAWLVEEGLIASAGLEFDEEGPAARSSDTS